MLHRKQRWVRIWHHLIPSYAIPMPSLSPLRCSKSWYELMTMTHDASWIGESASNWQNLHLAKADPTTPSSPNFQTSRKSDQGRGHGPWDATRNQPLSSRFSVAHLQHLAKSSGWFNSIHLTRLCMVHYGTKKWNTAKTAWPFPRSECCRAQPKSANMSTGHMPWIHNQQCLAT